MGMMTNQNILEHQWESHALLDVFSSSHLTIWVLRSHQHSSVWRARVHSCKIYYLFLGSRFSEVWSKSHLTRLGDRVFDEAESVRVARGQLSRLFFTTVGCMVETFRTERLA